MICKLLQMQAAVIILFMVPPLASAEGYAYSFGTTSIGTLIPETNETAIFDQTVIYDSGKYHYYACEYGGGGHITYRTATTLNALKSAKSVDVLKTDRGEGNCDPSVVKGSDGYWYLYFSNGFDPWATRGGVARSIDPHGPFIEISKDLFEKTGKKEIKPGEVHTKVVRGPEDYYYMAHFSSFEPSNNREFIILKSSSPVFTEKNRQEVTRFAPITIGRSVHMHLSYDLERQLFNVLVTEPKGVMITQFDKSWRKVNQFKIPLNLDNETSYEVGSALLTDAFARVSTNSTDAPNALVLAVKTSRVKRPFPKWVPQSIQLILSALTVGPDHLEGKWGPGPILWEKLVLSK